MAGVTSSYPAALDSESNLTPPNNGDTLSVADHWLAGNSGPIVAIETELGTDPAGSFTDVKSRLDAGGVGTAISVNASAPDNSLTIDANGHVFRSNLPAFNVYNSTGSSAFAANAVMTWDNEIIDNNNDFDLGNNRFVAPVDGIYFIAARIMSNNSQQLNYYLRKNSVQLQSSLVLAYLSTYQSGISAGIYSLAADDYIEVYNNSPNASYGAQYANFFGYLIG